MYVCDFTYVEKKKEDPSAHVFLYVFRECVKGT